MDEFAFIRDLLAPLSARAPGARGLGDDAASLAISPGHELVVTADAVVGGVHFLNDDPPDLIARKALRVNLSDLAAKGAAPLGFLMALSLPTGTTDDWRRAFVSGLARDVDEFRLPLIGGDTVSTPGPLTVAITALGEVPVGHMMTRAGAKIGDLVCVTGSIGDGALGLLAVQSRLPAVLTEYDLAFLKDRYALPQPRTVLGPRLRDHVSACLDVSDGLAADLGHICAQSNVGIEINADAVPVSPAARRALQADPALIQSVLGGGDDYELAFTIRPDRFPAAEEVVRGGAVPVSVIGKVVAGAGVAITGRDGAALKLASSGYRHG